MSFAILLLFGAGAGFIGSGIGMAIAAYRRPSRRSAINSTILSVIVGILIITLAVYYMKVSMIGEPSEPTINVPRSS